RDGVPLYRLPPKGVEVDRPARPVRIDALSFEVAEPAQLSFALACSKGTYIRVLAEEIGAALGTAAHLEALRRTGFGSFDIAQAAALDEWDPGKKPGFVSLRQAPQPLPAGGLDDRPRRLSAHG